MPSDVSRRTAGEDPHPDAEAVRRGDGESRPEIIGSGRPGLAASPDFMAGGGEMGALIRAKDWRDTPLGPPEFWPQSLRTVIRILLTSRYQMWMGWGPELSFFYNDAYRPTLGVKHGWALGAPASEVWREIWPDIGPRIEHVLRTGEATWDEALLLLLERSGYPEETYHTFSYSPLANDDGTIVGMLCVVTEETERVIGERQLSSLRDLASGIAGKYTRAEVLESVRRGLEGNPWDLPFTLTWLFGEDGLAHLAGATGVPPGHPIAPAVIDPADPGTVWPAAEIRGRGVPVMLELEDGPGEIPSGAWDKPPDKVLIAPIARQGQDEPAGFLVAGVNPYRRHDESWSGFVGLVAGQIASGLANADAYEEERRRAEALAEINRAKTTFFSNVSHEFRTPLTLMLSPLEDVLAERDGTVPAGHLALVRVAHRNGVRLLKLVNKLLDFSRIEADSAQAGFVPVDLPAATAELASNFHSAIEKAGLRLTVESAPMPVPVHVDPDMWEKIILNLMSNAFKFTFEGEIAVFTGPSRDGAFAEVTVRDSGIGIPPEEVPFLFERFRRVENALGRSIEGSGIGLALVRELVHLHGGTIRVESTPGKGSAFTVSIPFGTDHLPPDRIGAARSPRASGVRADAYVDEVLGWLTNDRTDPVERMPPAAMEDAGDASAPEAAKDRLILLADDNADMRTYVRRLLTSAGYRVETVTDGEQALAAAKALRPDLLLSDVMMPKMDGFGLLAELRRDPELRDTPILLLSARAGEEAKIEGLTAGADDYLTKPFSARELLARVRTNLDMSELRREAVRVENELRREAQIARERAEGILASINDGFLALDPDWRFTYVNAAAGRMFDRMPRDLLGKTFWTEYPEACGTAIETNFRHAMADQTSVVFEQFAAPSRRWFDIRAYPTRDGGLSVYFHDITDRKQAQELLQKLNETLEAEVAGRTAELRAKEARLRTIFETSYSFQALLSVDGILLDANATSLAAIGAPATDVAGKPFWETPWFSGTPGMPETIRAAVTAVAGGEVIRQEIHINLPAGGWRWFDFQMRPIRGPDGAVTAIVPEAVEVTARRQAEQIMRQAQKMEGIGQITGGVAHDFNNLLTIIAGNLESLRRQLLAPVPDMARVARSADNATRGAQRAVALTQRLLAFSRQQALEPKPLDVNRLVTGMSDLLRSTLGEQIAIETVLGGGLGQANIDANQLEIAILNLAVNARDAMPEGGRLTIETSSLVVDETDAAGHADLEPGDYIVLAISDTGSGMTPDTLSKAFEPFFTTKDVGHGTGLGLSQVYGFVRQSGGQVEIRSEYGKGTTVRLYLPRHQAEEAAAAEAAAAWIARGHRGETILVVEDEDDVRAFTTGILRELGYTVLEAPNGRVALSILEQHKETRLLFTDVGLPGGMNGRQLAEAAQRRHPELKVLFTTGYARDTIIHDGRLDPGVVLITKPFTFEAISQKLREVLDSGAQPRVLLVEDELLIQMLARENLEDLGFQVEVAETVAAARSKSRAFDGDFAAAIIDMGLPDGKGDGLARDLLSNNPALPVVIASGYDAASLRSLFEGYPAVGFLTKPYTTQQLQAALRQAGVTV